MTKFDSYRAADDCLEHAADGSEWSSTAGNGTAGVARGRLIASFTGGGALLGLALGVLSLGATLGCEKQPESTSAATVPAASGDAGGAEVSSTATGMGTTVVSGATDDAGNAWMNVGQPQPEVTGGALAGQPEASPSAAPAAPAAKVDPVVATVNGMEIHESDLDEAIVNALSLQSPQMLPMVRAQMPDIDREIMPLVINNALIMAKADEEKITLTDAEVVERIEQDINTFLSIQDMTREQFAGLVEAQMGVKLDDYLAEQAKSEEYRDMLKRVKLLETLYPEETQVTDEQVAEFYADNELTRFTTPTQVQASHILIGNQGMTPEQRAEAKTQAEQILIQAKAPDADFAALAREHSTCPSAQQGGDLGLFGRGQMVKPFEDAAYALQPGQVTDSLVETQFGFHIIKVTQRTEPKTEPLDKVAPQIRQELRLERLVEQEKALAETLRADAAIVYAEGYEDRLAPLPDEAGADNAASGEAAGGAEAAPGAEAEAGAGGAGG